jgi:hypothetical protein
MVRVMGNSPERRKISDLGDIIYYKQKKDYTDQEFNSSKDLQREVGAGTVLVLERFSQPRITADTAGKPDISTTVTEVLARLPKQQETVTIDDIKKVVTEAVNNIRIPDITAGTAAVMPAVRTSVDDPTYVPDIKMDHLKSSIQIESRKSDTNLSDAIEALKHIKK